MSIIRISTPFFEEDAQKLNAGDRVLLTGTIYTARDAAHKRLVELIISGNPLPIDIKNAIIYYVGPTPTKPGRVVGSAGPTTSYRMDAYAPVLLDLGLRGMIGKGNRSQKVVASMIKNSAVYFATIGGAAALISKTIVDSKLIAYEDLGSEAIRELTVVDFPMTVAIDSRGENLYKIGRKEYLASLRDS